MTRATRRGKPGRKPARVAPWAEVPTAEPRCGWPWVRGLEGAEQKAIEAWGLDRFRALRGSIVRADLAWSVARDRTAIGEDVADVVAKFLDRLDPALRRLAAVSPAYAAALAPADRALPTAPEGLSLLLGDDGAVISAGGNGDIAPDWSPAAVLSDDERRMVREYRMVRHTAEVLRERVLRALGATRTAIGGFPLRDGATRLEAVATALVRAERQPGFARANGDVSPIAPDEAAALSIAAWVEDVPADAAAYAVVRGLWAKRLRSARARVGARRRRHGAIGGE